MQNIIIFGIGALVCSLFLSNFIKLSSILKGEDFNFKDLDEKIGSTLEKLLDEGILKRQYMEKQDEE